MRQNKPPPGQARDNPVLPASALAALLPSGVGAAELHGSGDPEQLGAEEWQSIRHCHESRIADFAAGRLCAREALRQLGMQDVSLLPGPDRQPVWPAGITGSITHTQGYAAAVVARREQLAALGIDSLCPDELERRLWPRICTPQELAELGAQTLRTPDSLERRAALIFAAKEAFFKCQYALAQEWLGFCAVRIAFDEDDGRMGVFRVIPLRPLRLLDHLGGDVRHLPSGRWYRHGVHLTAAIAVPAAAARGIGGSPAQ